MESEQNVVPFYVGRYNNRKNDFENQSEEKK
jgi:hypothetical protein